VSDTTDRQRLLTYAAELIHGDRNESYDEPAANFARIAALWSAYLGVELEPHDVAVLNVLQKVARLMHTPGHDARAAHQRATRPSRAKRGEAA